MAWVFISTSGFFLNALINRKNPDVAKKQIFCWGLSTVYALIGFALAFFLYK